MQEDNTDHMDTVKGGVACGILSLIALLLFLFIIVIIGTACSSKTIATEPVKKGTSRISQDKTLTRP